MDFGVIAFSNTHNAMRTERFLRGRFPVQMMPTPRSITAACGISVRFQPDDADGVLAAVKELRLPHGEYGIYSVEPDGRIAELEA